MADPNKCPKCGGPADEAIKLRREKYRLEAVIETMWKAMLHQIPCPPETVREGSCFDKTCRECWSKYLEYEL